jgi:hypothetical protein
MGFPLLSLAEYTKVRDSSSVQEKHMRTLALQWGSLPLDKLIEVLSPDSLDIGVSKTPVDQVVEIFKHAQSQTKKND